jgi:hypothetical protein
MNVFLVGEPHEAGSGTWAACGKRVKSFVASDGLPEDLVNQLFLFLYSHRNAVEKM